MRRAATAFLLALGLCGLGVSTGISKDKPMPLTIEYHGQSFFVLTTSKGKRIAFDPHYIEAYERRDAPKVQADIVCISHNHNDHTRVDILEEPKKVKVLRGLKGLALKSDWAVVDETIDDIRFKSVGVYHDDQEGFVRGKNAVFIVEVDGWRVVHLGDLGHQLTERQIKRIGPVDVLMVPAGGIYTLNGAEAKKVVEQLKPKEYVFPMHHGTEVFKDILPVDEFFDGQPARNVVRLSDTEPDPTKRENIITLNRDAARPRPLLVQLHYWPKEEKKKK